MVVRKARRGRKPSIDRDRIARAVRAVGRRGRLAMQAVADEIGVDVTTLYRHVGGVDELRRIWATLAAPSAWPDHRGLSWSSWLAKVAHTYHELLLDNPELVEHAATAFDPDFEGLDRSTRILIGYGFEPREAVSAYSFLVNQLIGYVAQELRIREGLANGVSPYTMLVQAIERGAKEGRLATLRGIDFRAKDFDRDAVFSVFLDYLIDGIRARPGAPKEKS
jgi:hypothetical protein